MKRIISLFLALMLLCGTCAFAEESNTPQFSSTLQFTARLDAAEVKYTYLGINDSGNEMLSIGNSDSDAGIEYDIVCFFEPNNENASFYVWNLINYDPAQLGDVLYACNKCNYDWKYVKFYADETDNTVTADLNLIFRGDSAGDVCVEALVTLVTIVGDAYTTYLAPYAK